MSAFLYDGPEGPLRTLVVRVGAYVVLVFVLRVSGKRTLAR